MCFVTCAGTAGVAQFGVSDFFMRYLSKALWASGALALRVLYFLTALHMLCSYDCFQIL